MLSFVVARLWFRLTFTWRAQGHEASPRSFLESGSCQYVFEGMILQRIDLRTSFFTTGVW